MARISVYAAPFGPKDVQDLINGRADHSFIVIEYDDGRPPQAIRGGFGDFAVGTLWPWKVESGEFNSDFRDHHYTSDPNLRTAEVFSGTDAQVDTAFQLMQQEAARINSSGETYLGLSQNCHATTWAMLQAAGITPPSEATLFPDGTIDLDGYGPSTVSPDPTIIQHAIDTLGELMGSFQCAADYVFGQLQALGGWFLGLPDWLVDEVLPGTVSARTEASPLVLDLDGDGIELAALGAAGSVFWDIDNDGFREASAWVRPDDGILALDRNNDGRINDHSELFGTQTLDGFTVLRELDNNGDDRIDTADAAYADLRVWRDLDSDGQSATGELFTLAQLGIASISLADSPSNTTIAGNRVTHVSTYTTSDGTTRSVADVWFQYDNVNTISGRTGVAIPENISALPELRGYGAIASLSLSMTTDTGLLTLVQTIAGQSLAQLLAPSFDFDGKFRQMLWQWADVEGRAAYGRGSNIDGRDLAFLEVLTDRPFDQRGSPNPAVEAGTTLRNSMEAAVDALLFRFFAQQFPDSFISGIDYYDPLRDEVVGNLGIDFVKLNAIVSAWGASGATLAQGWATIIRIIDGAFGIDDLTTAQRTALQAAITASDPAGTLTLTLVMDQVFPPRGLGLNGTSGIDTINGGTGNDSISGENADDILSGRGGHDSLNGGAGNDTLAGETGDDTLQGGAGNDIYLYTTGLDTIRDSSGTDTVRFGADVTLANLSLTFSPTNGADAQVYVNGVLSLIIEDMFTANGLVETFTFADGSSVNLATLTGRQTGTTGADTLTGADSAFFPHDYIDGGNGDDRITGGLGDDRLFGGSGNDSYVVTAGHDRITDASGTDRIEFGSAFASADARFTRSGYDLLISFSGVVAATVIGQFNGGAVETVQFANGTVIELLAQRYRLDGTAAGDRLDGSNSGAAGDDLFGLGGNDRIYGNAGDDVIDGGAGDDLQYGGIGNDRYIRSLGTDTVSDGGGVDTIDLGAVAMARVTLTRDGSDLIVAVDTIPSIRIAGQFTANGQIETLIANGQTIDLLAFKYQITGSDAGEYLYGITYGGSPDDDIRGLDGDDTIQTYAGNDRLDGGLGNDSLYGGIGNDSYHVGGGWDYVSDDGAATDTLDTLYLPDGLTFASLTLTRRTDGDIVISWAGGGVVIDRAYDAADAIERLVVGGLTYNLVGFTLPTNGTSANDSLTGNQEELGSRDDRLFGLDGNDTLTGYDGADILDGGAGDDAMLGGAGGDIYRPGSGINTISDVGVTGDAADRLVLPTGVALADVTYTRSGDGSLLLSWAGGSVRIANAFDHLYAIETIETATGTSASLVGQAFVTRGTAGNDSISGNQEELGSRNDTILGLDGNDTLSGMAGNDRLTGGAGNDTMNGGDGADIYYVGQGFDVIDETGQVADAADAIYLDSGITPAQVTRYRTAEGDIVLDWGTGGVRIDDAWDQRSAIETLHFATGEVWQLTAIAIETRGSSADETLGGNREELGSRNDVIRGLGGNDTLNGYEGDDLLDGGAGDDTLNGAGGADTYLVGYGWDYVNDAGVTGDGSDVVKIDRAGITAANLVFTRLSNNDITISWNGGADGVTLYRGQTGNNTIEIVELADGSRLTLSAQTFLTATVPVNQTFNGDATANTITGGAGNDTLNGQAGDDTLDGGAGNDTLNGGAGVDSYRVGQGHDYVNDSGATGDAADRIILPTGVLPAAISYVRLSDGDLLVSWTGGSVRINNAFDTSSAVELLQFADGSTVNLASVSFVTRGTDNAETLGGNREELGSRNDRIEGLDGDDILNGYDGNDVLVGGAGRNTLNGAEGDDHYHVTGNDWITDTAGNDRLYLPAGVTAADLRLVRDAAGDLTIHWASGSVWIDNAYDLSRAVEQIVFADGTSVALTSLPFETHGSGAGETLSGNTEELGSRNDILRGFDGNDTLNGQDGADTLDGGAGNDLMQGGAGGDRYLVDGHDAIVDAGATGDAADTIVLPASVTAAQLVLTRSANGDLLLSWNSGSVSIRYGLDANYAIETIAFADGTSRALLSLPFTTQGTNAGETINGNSEELGSRNNSIFGRDGDDRLNGDVGDDLLDGGLGNDQLHGGAGSDSYRAGGGDDFISDYSAVGDGDDILYIPNGILPSGVTVTRLTDGDLLLRWTGGSVRIDRGLEARYAIEQIRFQNGTVWTPATLAFETVGTGGAETLYGDSPIGNPNDVIRGQSGNDRLEGRNGDDTLDGAGGSDLLDGGAGDDILIGGAGGDVYVPGTGVNRITETGGGTDLLRLSSDVALVDIRFLRPGGNAVELRWNGGSVVLDQQLGGGNNVVEGLQIGSGAILSLTALLALDTSGTPITAIGDDYANVILGNGDANTLYGLGGNDVMLGGGGRDTLVAGSGNDQLNGGSGDDTLYGGAGSDIYVVDSQGDVIFENANEGTENVRSTANYYLWANVENLTLVSGAENIFGVGNALANILVGNEGGNLLLGGGGNDTLSGGAGIDILYGEDGIDRLSGDADNDVLVGGAGNDVIDGGTGGDSLYGEDGNDTLTGGSDFVFDMLVGGAGDDVIRGDSGLGDYDYLYGNAGNDTFYVDTHADLVFEGAGEGTDTVYAAITGGGYYLYANIENLILLGGTAFGAGNDLANRVTGNALGNYLLGGAGNDILNGKTGNDVLFGEAGADRFVFERGTGSDTIGDFAVGVDRIDLSAFGFSSYAQVQAATGESGGTAFITLGNGDFIILNGVAKAALGAGDFILSGGSNSIAGETPYSLDENLRDWPELIHALEGPRAVTDALIW